MQIDNFKSNNTERLRRTDSPNNCHSFVNLLGTHLAPGRKDILRDAISQRTQHGLKPTYVKADSDDVTRLLVCIP